MGGLSLCCFYLINEPRLLEGFVGAALFHGLETFCRNAYGDFFAEFGNEKGLALEVDLTAARTRRVEFGSTNTVGVAASDL